MERLHAKLLQITELMHYRKLYLMMVPTSYFGEVPNLLQAINERLPIRDLSRGRNLVAAPFDNVTIAIVSLPSIANYFALDDSLKPYCIEKSLQELIG